MRCLRLVFSIAFTFLVGCASERASSDQCREIFNRLVVLELRQMGFDDPALAARRQTALATRFQNELDACLGRPLPAGALACLQTANTSATLAQNCLE